MSTKISDLLPSVAVKALAALQAMTDRRVPYAVTSTLRTTAEQQALFAQGRMTFDQVNALRATAGMRLIVAAENLYTVTNADGIHYLSNHQSGKALDVVPTNSSGAPEWPVPTDIRWSMIATVMIEFGFFWGGTWTKAKDGIDPDLPHYQIL
jgi:hypothetical protein